MKHTPPEKFTHYIATFKPILLFVLALFFSPAQLHAGGGSGCTAGEKDCPIELILSGAKRDNDSPEKYYYFIVPAVQNIQAHITNHADKRKMKLSLHPLAGNGSCDTDTLLAQTSSSDNFTLNYQVERTGIFCLHATGSWFDRYNIDVDGDATLRVGISKASAREDEGPMSLRVSLTRAAPWDVTTNFTLVDGSAKLDTNYHISESPGVRTGKVTIPGGQLYTDLNVSLKDQGMKVTKLFYVNLTGIDRDDVALDEGSTRATGYIIGRDSQDADMGEDGPDICYSSRPTSGFCFFGMCLFYKETTNIRANRSGLSNISTKKALTRGIAFMDFFSSIGIDGEKKSPRAGDDTAEVHDFFNSNDAAEMVTGGLMEEAFFYHSMFPRGTEYRLGEGADATTGGSMNRGDTASYYDKALFKIGLFTQYTHIVTYTKNGEQHQETLQPCNPDSRGVLTHEPALNDCGIFIGALNAARRINFAHPQSIYEADGSPLKLPLLAPEITGATGEYVADAVGSGIMAMPKFDNWKSQESSSISLAHSGVISEQHVGNIKIGRCNGDGCATRHIVFEAPYSGTYQGRAMMIRSITDTDTSSDTYHYVFKRGDYWIEDWMIDKSANVTIEAAGDVRIFVKNKFIINLNGSTLKMGFKPDDGNKGSDCSSSRLYLYAYDGFKTHSGNTLRIRNSYIYSKGDIVFGGSAKADVYYTSITADDMLDIQTASGGTFSVGDNSCKARTDESELFNPCPPPVMGFITGPFDAWDTFRDRAKRAPKDRNISTKISAKEFDLSVASLDSNRTKYEIKKGAGAVEVSIYDINSFERISERTKPFNASLTSHETSLGSFAVKRAAQKAAAAFRFCATYAPIDDTSPLPVLTLHPKDDCAGADYNCTMPTTRRTPKWHVCYSSDTFTIRPDHFEIDAPTSDIVAGKSFALTLHAKDAKGNDTADYNETIHIWGASPSLDHNDTQVKCQPSTRALTLDIKNGTDINFTNGKAIAQLKYTEVGHLNVTLQEHPKSDFAHYDIDGTDFDIETHDSPNHGGSIHRAIDDDNKTLSFVADHLSVDVTLLNHHRNPTPGTLNYTYLSNDPTIMGAPLTIHISAKNKDGATLQNYNADCYAKNLNAISIGYQIDGNVSSSTNPGIISNILYSLDDDDPKRSLQDTNPGGTPLSSTLRLSHSSNSNNMDRAVFSTDHNGTAILTAKLNFDRSYSTPTNPFVLHIVDVNVTGSDAITGRDATIDQNATYLYARVKATKDVYDDVSTPTIMTPVMVQVYCDRLPSSALQCPQINLAQGATRDSRWWLSAEHNTLKDGAVKLTVSESGASADLAIKDNGSAQDSLVVPIRPNNLGRNDQVQASNYINGTVNVMMTGAHHLLSGITGDYDHPTALYKIIPITRGQWAGYGKTGKVVDSNSSIKKNHRLSW